MSTAQIYANYMASGYTNNILTKHFGPARPNQIHISYFRVHKIYIAIVQRSVKVGKRELVEVRRRFGYLAQYTGCPELNLSVIQTVM